MAPAAPPLPPQAQPQPLAQPAVGPCTYQEHYSNAANDPWRGNYATLMAQYMTVPPAITPELLLTRMIVYHHGASTPQAFIMLMTPDPAQASCIILMHWLTQFLVSVLATQWEEMVMAFEGDVLGGQICMTVEWPVTAFRQAANSGALQVPTLANLDALFNVDPPVELVGPFVVNELGTELIRT
jgi:hypothetical protein